MNMADNSNPVCLLDVPNACLAQIATYLDGESLMSLLLLNKSISKTIRTQRQYIHKVRTFETFTANPYRYYVIDNTSEKKSKKRNKSVKPYVRARDTLDEVRDMCDLNQTFTEELTTPYGVSHGSCFQFRIDNGLDDMYITNLLINAEFKDRNYVNIEYGKGALRITFRANLINLMQPDSDGYYHFFEDFMLLVPKLVKGFNDTKSYLFLEIASSNAASIRVVRRKVDETKAVAWMSNYEHYTVSMPSVRYNDCETSRVASSTKVVRLNFWFVCGRTIAICVDIRRADNNIPLNPAQVDKFIVSYVQLGRVESTVTMKAQMVHSSFVEKYKAKVGMSLSLHNCFIIPLKAMSPHEGLDGSMYVDVHLKSPMNTVSSAFYFHDFEHIYFSN